MALFQRRKSILSLSLMQQLSFMKRLATLLEANYSMKEALHVLKFNKTFHHVAETILARLSNGDTLDHILRQIQFHPQFITHVHYGLLRGHLSDGIIQAITFIDKQHRLKQHFLKTIRYPLVLIFGFLIMLYFIQMYIYPNFLQLFQTAHQTPDLIETAIFSVSLLFHIVQIVIVLLILFIILTFLIYKKVTPDQLMTILLRLPIAFRLTRLHTSFFFAHHLKNLLDAQYSMKEAFTLIHNQERSSILNQTMIELLANLNDGETLYQCLAIQPFFSERLSYIFQNYEAQTLIRSSLDIYMTETIEDVTNTIEKSIHLIQPIIFTIIALSIVLIYLSLLMPMVEMMNTL
ncbi:competence protein ComG [Halolactibacillus miurensis]|nr:type II secretion system F family protein [Halolactibacillus miurensis]GEM04411.1 competence protein ComG [Halolactibacillus miurensis]